MTERTQAMQVSLRELFFLLSFGAVMSWVASVGVANEMFWPSAIVSLVVSLLWFGVARIKSGRWLAVLLPALPFFFCALPIASIGLLLHLMLLMATGLVLACIPQQSARTVAATGMWCLALSYAATVIYGMREVRELRALREKFPAVAVSHRVAYEREHRGGRAQRESRHPAPVVLNTLAEWEDDFGSPYSLGSRFRVLHDSRYDAFIRASGFGVFRMPRRIHDGISVPEIKNVAFDEHRQTSLDYDYHPNVTRTRRPEFTQTDTIYSLSRDEFIHPDSLGAVTAHTGEVVGFQPHAFRNSPVALLDEPVEWHIESLQLVSLLKFDEPKVYVLDHLPRMDQLSSDDFPTRELDDFEREALEKLRLDRDVVVSQQEGATRMLGSLRAATQCLECHSVARGELLGAFTYLLRPVHVAGDAVPPAEEASD